MQPEERDLAYLWDMREAARRVSSELQGAHAATAWRGIIAQRNVLAHEYGTDPVATRETR